MRRRLLGIVSRVARTRRRAPFRATSLCAEVTAVVDRARAPARAYARAPHRIRTRARAHRLFAQAQRDTRERGGAGVAVVVCYQEEESVVVLRRRPAP